MHYRTLAGREPASSEVTKTIITLEGVPPSQLYGRDCQKYARPPIGRPLSEASREDATSLVTWSDCFKAIAARPRRRQWGRGARRVEWSCAHVMLMSELYGQPINLEIENLETGSFETCNHGQTAGL